mmetsp:Transcript_33419/g.77097  ORF Transcript_33419/g.77097 Transcript_33419/m.77097 type:complete len:221 (+) Transcript_33419:204-866(+)
MLHDVDLHTTADIYNATRRYQTYQPPGVKTYCFYGAGTPTPLTLKYTAEDVYDSGALEYVEVDGDGAVTIDSLNVCDLWAEEDPDMYTVVRLTNATHVGTIQRADKYIRSIAYGNITKMLRQLGGDIGGAPSGILEEEGPYRAPGARPPPLHATEGDGLTPYVHLATAGALVVGVALLSAPLGLGVLAARRVWTWQRPRAGDGASSVPACAARHPVTELL